jgi:signal transduction histidine kinase
MQSSVALVKKYCETGDTENQLKHLDKIKKNINLLNDMLNDFLSLNKFDEDFSKSYPIEINLKSFITEFISELGHLLSEKQVCAMEYAGEELVFVDDKILKSALFILASNAIKYSLENGTILIKTSVSKTNIEIIVKDNGIGILEVDKKHIFERFFRGSNAAYIQGTGLGLTIVQKYVQQMNASLSFESDLNKGTKFTLTIPQKT